MQYSVYFFFSEKSIHPMPKNLLLAQAKNQKVWSQKLAILLNQIECKMAWFLPVIND